jgi:hypothetical protein
MMRRADTACSFNSQVWSKRVQWICCAVTVAPVPHLLAPNASSVDGRNQMDDCGVTPQGSSDGLSARAGVTGTKTAVRPSANRHLVVEQTLAG